MNERYLVHVTLMQGIEVERTSHDTADESAYTIRIGETADA